MRIVVTGVAGSVGSRVAFRLVSNDDNEVLGVDNLSSHQGASITQYVGDLRSLDLDEVFTEADSVVHLASAYGRNEFVDASAHDTELARLVFRAAARQRVTQVVLLSSAMVYGARHDNPVPLTEVAPVAPNPMAFAENKATLERLGAEWKRQTGSKLAVVRPTTALAEDESSWVSRSLQLAAGLGSDANPDMQFLHLDDLAEAVAVLVEAQADGPFNVAPDGWVRAEEIRQLSGRAPRVPLPAPVASALVRLSWDAGIAATPPGILHYATNPWVVANDKLKSLGWVPKYSNTEAYVEGHDPRPWAMLSAKRRQQLALGGSTLVFVCIAAVLRRVLRRNRFRT